MNNMVSDALPSPNWKSISFQTVMFISMFITLGTDDIMSNREKYSGKGMLIYAK